MTQIIFIQDFLATVKAPNNFIYIFFGFKWYIVQTDNQSALKELDLAAPESNALFLMS